MRKFSILGARGLGLSVGRLFLFGMILALAGKFVALDLMFPVHTEVEYSTIIYSSDSTVIHAFLTSDDKWRMKTESYEITDRLKTAFVEKEDKYFEYHPGINAIAVLRALFNNIISGKRTSGASTITMQVARLLEPKRRSYFNKTIEMFRALQLEWHFSKDEIFEMYINLVPYGGNIEGVKSASILFFEKSPELLSLAEVTSLCVVPNRPTSLALGRNNKGIVEARNKWLDVFEESKVFSSDEIADARVESMKVSRHDAPFLAPQFSLKVRDRHSNVPNIYSTIELKHQMRIEQLTKNYIQRMYFRGIRNAAVVVVENRTRNIVSYVGSADFYNTEDAGQVDGVQAIRSPGSTLKPLIYGLGFDQGWITPKSVVSDVRVNFQGYEPGNYDGKLNGAVTIENALCNSLNIPAVLMLNKIGVPDLVESMEEMDFKSIGAKKDGFGLSLALGGCGVSLFELTGMYCALADSGVYKPLNWTRNRSEMPMKKILSSGATFMITEILTELERPDLPMEWKNSTHLPRVAWKTGTSYGRRDAWSIGYNKNYTVGVWVGNFSGEGVYDLSGADVAAPLLFQVFNVIDYSENKDWYSMPSSLEFRYVCAESGDLPNDFCENQVMDYFIPFVSSSKICTHAKYIWISQDSLISYCSECLPQNGYIKALYPNHAPEIIDYYIKNQIPYVAIPDHNPDCEHVFSDTDPRIVSPVSGTEYFIGADESSEILLDCNAANDVQTVYWYVNDEFLISGKPGARLFFKPLAGKVKVSCSDDKGRTSAVRFTVKQVDF